MLGTLDIVLTFLHLLIIGFNLFGWIWPKARRAHLICILLTAGSWLVLGIWFGLGYCPLTDWQWNVKQQLGEQNLPNSFIKYYADKLSGRDIDVVIIDIVTALSFIIASILSVYVNFFRRFKNVVQHKDKIM